MDSIRKFVQILSELRFLKDVDFNISIGNSKHRIARKIALPKKNYFPVGFYLNVNVR